MAKKNKNKSQLDLLKYYALKLRARHQIPYRLCYFIMQIDKETDIRVINYLKQLTEDYMRVNGYYLTHKNLEEELNRVIQDGYNDVISSLEENA